jgi:3-phenylpropionate/trans-cinnamate dioxygenase ferredoxin reductase component
MSDPRTFAIVGAGLAGAKAAQALRTEGFDGRIALLGAEPRPPYERPPLSKGYLQGSSDRDTVYVHPRTGTPSTRSSSASTPRSPRSTAAPTRS